MPQDQDLFGRTFDQQVVAAGGNIEACGITPNRRIPAEIVFEPTGARIRVTAYDANNEILFQHDDSKKKEDAPTPRQVKGEVVFEPMGTGVRVTARDEEHKVLWGYVGSRETVHQMHCLVAVYDTLQKTLAQELEKRCLINPETVDPVEQAKQTLQDLQDTLNKLRDCILVQKKENATTVRARQITRIAGDANRMINLELSALGPLPQVAKERAMEIAQRHCIESLMEFTDGKPPAEWDKKKREEWAKKCWFISAVPRAIQTKLPSSWLVGIGKKDGLVRQDSQGNP